MKRGSVIGIVGLVAIASIFGIVQVSKQGGGETAEEEPATAPDAGNVEEGETTEVSKDQSVAVQNKEVADFIERHAEKFPRQLDDPRLRQANGDEGFNYYLKAKTLAEEQNVLDFSQESEALQKDFLNLFLLTSAIQNEQFVRTAHIGQIGQAKEDVEHSDQWKPTSDRMRQAYAYISQILHDLNIAVNHNEELEPFGVTHTLNGENVPEIQSFTQGDG